jgi:hypothetical protein
MNARRKDKGTGQRKSDPKDAFFRKSPYLRLK